MPRSRRRAWYHARLRYPASGPPCCCDGVDFAAAEHVLAGPTFTFEDDRGDHGERRWITLGLSGMKVVVVVHTETEDEIRVISIREADSDEQLLFFTNLR